MARNIFSILKYDDDTLEDSFTVLATGNEIVDVDLYSANNAQFIVNVTYPNGTSATTGYRIETYYGIGGNADGMTTWQTPCKLGGLTEEYENLPKLCFSTNFDEPAVADTEANSGSEVISNTFFSTADLRTSVSRYLRIKIYNDDPSEEMIVRIWMDM